MKNTYSFRAWHETSKRMLQIGDDYGTVHPLDCCTYVIQKQPVILMLKVEQKDTNKKDIYEHDIVEISAFAQGDGITYTRGLVVFNGIEFTVESEDNSWPVISWTCIYEVKVLGNKYEHPNLYRGMQ